MENGFLISRDCLDLCTERILFLDRDGVIIDDVGHISDSREVKVIKGISELIANARKGGIPVVVVTNQASVARGIISEQDYVEITDTMLRLLEESVPDMIISSFFHQDFSESSVNSDWRKPDTGMFEYVLSRSSAIRNRCIMVGDRITDLQAAANAGVNRLFLVDSKRYPDEPYLLDTFSWPRLANVSQIAGIEELGF